MSISVDMLRGLASNKTVVLTDGGASVGNAGRLHSIAGFFGTKAAKAVNRETLDAIKKAVCTDSRYFGVREKAAELLSAVGDGKNVNSSRIKSIIDHLDSLTTPESQKRLLLERFSVHLANRELPAGWRDHVGDIMSYMNGAYYGIVSAAGGDVGNVNLSLVLDNLCETLSAVTEASGGDPDTIDLAADILVRRPDAMETPEKARALVQKAGPVLEELRELDRMNPGTGIIARGIGIMKAMSSVVGPGVMKALHEAAARIDPGIVRMLGDGGRDLASDLHQMLKNLFATVANGGISYPEGAGLDDSDGMLSALNFIYGDFAASLPQPDREALLDRLTGGAGMNLRLFYEDVGGREAINSIKIYDAMVESLQKSLGRPAERIDAGNRRCDFSEMPLKVLGDYPVETMYIGSAGRDGDRIVSSRRNLMKTLQFGQQESPDRSVDPDTYLRNRINEQGKVRMNEDFSLSMHRFASGEITMFEKDINRSMKVVLPNGVRLPSDFRLAREEVARYVAGDPGATYAGLDDAARNKAWLLMSLISQETEKIAQETAPAVCSGDRHGPMYLIRSGEGMRLFTVSETETGDWIVRSDASYRLDGILYDEQNQMMTGPDTRLDAVTEICVPRAEIDRIAGLATSAFSGMGTVSLDAAVSVAIVHRLTPPLGEEGKARYDISQIPGKLGLTGSETRMFESIAGYEMAILGSASDAYIAMANGQAPSRRLLFYPALLADQSTYAHCKELMTAFDKAFDALSKGDAPTIPSNYKGAVERLVFEELNDLAASGRSLPSLKDFEKGLASGNAYLDFARWGFGAAGITHSLLSMPVEFRRPMIAALKAFRESTDIMLFNRLVAHREGILRLHSRGRLTAASAYTEIMGRDAPVPFTERSPASNVRNCFANAIMDGVKRYVDENSERNPKVAEMMGPVYVLLSKYSMSVEDAFSVALGERRMGADDKVLNPFEPVVYQKVGGNASTALGELAKDLNRMTYGYAADGRTAKIAPGSVFTFHFPDGSDASVSSLPVGMDAKQLSNYNSGNQSSLTRLLGIYIWQLCGVGHAKQGDSLILGLGQGCLAPLRDMAAIHGVQANEHSQVRIDLRKLDNGDVTLRVSNPENCPLEFDWTVTVAPDGRQTMGEVNMRRAAGFVAVEDNDQ